MANDRIEWIERNYKFCPECGAEGTMDRFLFGSKILFRCSKCGKEVKEYVR